MKFWAYFGMLMCCSFIMGSQEDELDSEKLRYIVNLPQCKIPEVPLLNPSILPEWNVTFDTVNCPQEPDLSNLSEDGELSLTKYAKDNFEKCCYVKIMRPQNLPSDTYLLSECIPIPREEPLKIPDEEYFYVRCKKKNENHNRQYERPLSLKFHSQTRIKKSIESKVNYWNKLAENEKPISVMFLIIDSISRSHAYRAFPNTLEYIFQEMNFIDFKGYHSMGEPTIENEVPFMLGTTTSDWEMKKPNYVGKYDSIPFIWKTFSDSNYVTMENQDAPAWGTFNFNGRLGFTKKPFDYFSRPYYLVQDKLNGKYTKKTTFISHTERRYGTTSFSYDPMVCVENQPIYDFLFGRAFKFLQTISPKLIPSFSFSFLSWPNHDYLAGSRLLDHPLSKLMKNIRESPDIYDNTMIIFMGDHGFRWANYSDTQEGLLERDLPLFTVRLPERFANKYPQLAQNMKENTLKVTSHLDLFKLLAHIHQLGLPSKEQGKNRTYGYNRTYGISLLDKIPAERTCEDAKIPASFCACNYPLYSKEFSFDKYLKDKAIEGISTVAKGG